MVAKKQNSRFAPKWLSRMVGPFVLSFLFAVAIAVTWLWYWNYPESPDRVVTFPHLEKRISAFSPDGKSAEAIPPDKDSNFFQPRIINIEDGRTIIEPARLVRPISSNLKDIDPEIAHYIRDHTKTSGFDPTGRSYCIVSNQFEVVELPSGRTRFTHPLPAEKTVDVNHLWSRDGSTFAVLEKSKPSKLTIYDVTTGQVRQQITGPRTPCDLSANGRWLLAKSADADNECQIVDAANGQVRHRIAGPLNTMLQFARVGVRTDVAAIGFGIEPKDDEQSNCDVQIISVPDAKIIGKFQSRRSYQEWTTFWMNDQFLQVGGQTFDLHRDPITYIDDLLGSSGVVFAEKINRLVTSKSNNSGHGDFSIRDPKTLVRLNEGIAWDFHYIADDGRYLTNINDQYLTPNEITRYVLPSGRSYANYSMNVIDVLTGQTVRRVSLRKDYETRSSNPVLFRPEHDEVWIEDTRNGKNNLAYHIFGIKRQKESTFWPWTTTGVFATGYFVLLVIQFAHNKASQRRRASPSLT